MKTSSAVLAACMLAALSLAGCEDKAPGDDGNGTDDPLDSLYWPFRDVVYPPGWEYSLFVQWPDNDTAAPTIPLGFDWITDHSGFYNGFFDIDGDTLGQLTFNAMETDVPRFGMEGFNATRVDIYIFIDNDELLAHTESIPFQEINRVPFIGDSPTLIPDELYYLGENETAPNGTEPLPFYMEPYKDEMRELATGLPVGGAASIIVPASEAGIIGEFYGDLYVTAQLTELVYAP